MLFGERLLMPAPSAYRSSCRALFRYAVDFDGDGVADLRNSSTARSAAWRTSSWRTAGPRAKRAARRHGRRRRITAPIRTTGLQPRYLLAELAKAGIVPIGASPAGDTRATLVELGNPGRAERVPHWACQNFYVLTRYNRSSFYASAVTDLAKALRAAIP